MSNKNEDAVTMPNDSNDALKWQLHNFLKPSERNRGRSVFPHEEHFPGNVFEQVTNDEIMEKLNAIDRKLDLIFGSHVLLNGDFVDIKEMVKSNLNLTY